MADYQAKSITSLFFDVTAGDRLIGKLIYTSWFKFDATMEMSGNSNYQVVPKGFWGTTIELKEGENILLTFKMNWSGDIVLQTFFNAIEKDYVFKHRGFFKESYVLLDQEGKELLVMKPHVKWNKMKYEYEIITTDQFETFPKKDILLMTSLHCANYYMSMMMASIGCA